MLGEICRFYQFIAEGRERGDEGESACIAGRGRSSPPFVAAATQVPFTASNVIIKFAERCLAKCQDGREEERGARSSLVIFNALNEKVCGLFFWSNIVGETAVALALAAPPVSA